MDFKRASRVAELLRQEVSRIIRDELKDPLVGMTTISTVRLTDDLRFARIFVSVIGDKKTAENTLKGLGRATPFIRSEIGKRTDLRFIPEIKFIYDDSIEYAMSIEELIKRTKS